MRTTIEIPSRPHSPLGRSILVLAAFSFFISGCVVSEAPLSNVDKSSIDEELLAAWANSGNPTTAAMRIERVAAAHLPAGMMRCVPDKVDEAAGGKIVYFWTTLVDGQRFGNVPCDGSDLLIDCSDAVAYQAWRNEGSQRVRLFQYVIRDNTLQVFYRTPSNDPRVLSGDAPSIKQVLTDPHARVFSDTPQVFQRVGSLENVEAGVDVANDKRNAPRKWHSADGTLLAEGTYLSLSEGKVRVRFLSGKTGRIAIGKLAEADQQYVREQLARDGLSGKPGEGFEIEDESVGGKEGSRAEAGGRVRQDEAMLRATRLAWNGIMEADAQLGRTKFESPSEQYRETAFLYSRIPLDGVDPVLVKHVLRGVRAYKAAVPICSEFERQRGELMAQVNQAQGLGYALGASAASAENQGGAANGLALLFGGVAQADAAAKDKANYERFLEQFAPVRKELEAVDKAEQEVADFLTRKYGVEFVDSF